MDAKLRSSLEQLLVHTDGEFGGHVQLPAERTDIGDASCTHRRIAQREFLAGGEWERIVGEVGSRELL